MARFETDGLDDLIYRVDQLGLAESEVADAMLMAAAEEDKKAWQQSALMHGLKDYGDMIDSIGYARKPTRIQGIRYIDIYPQGMGRPRPRKRKGGSSPPVRNAEKAFYNHYGTSRINATHWVDDADKLAAEPVQQAMEQVFDKYLNEKGMI